jgi:hypothetical protein
MPRGHVRLAVVLLAALAGACGGSQNSGSHVRPFGTRLARVFDDSVDYVESVEGLGGRVATDWQQQIDSLARAAGR